MYCFLPVYLHSFLIVLDSRDTVGSIQLKGVIYMFSGRSSKSVVMPSILSQAFEPATNNVILVLNTRDVQPKTPFWIEKVKATQHDQLWSLGQLDSQCFDNLTSAQTTLDITKRFMQDDSMRLVLDETWGGFRLASVKDKWWIIKRRSVPNTIYDGGCDINLMLLTTTTNRARKEIMDWLLGKTSADAHILWLHGPAGEGKSTLARALTNLCRSQNLLLATFFFSRMDPTCNTIQPLVPTIVDQIGNASPLAKELITNAIGDQSVFLASFAIQLNQLALQPLSKLGVSDFPRLIIIDGLDECDHPDMQSEVVKGIVESRQTMTNTEYLLCFVVFSRPNNNLRDTFALAPNSMVHHVVVSGEQWLRFGDFSAPRAIHSSQERYDPPKCHPNTRVAIRDKLMEWATQETITTKDPRILWFYGGPGTGKSAVAQTLAETLQSQNLLLATFFFSRTDSTRNTINPVAATIAFQIGTIIPDLQKLIVKALDNNPRLMNERS